MFAILFLLDHMGHHICTVQLCDLCASTHDGVFLDEILNVSVETHIYELRQRQRTFKLSEQLLHKLYFGH
jgi:hypothetical protein